MASCIIDSQETLPRDKGQIVHGFSVWALAKLSIATLTD